MGEVQPQDLTHCSVGRFGAPPSVSTLSAKVDGLTLGPAKPWEALYGADAVPGVGESH